MNGGLKAYQTLHFRIDIFLAISGIGDGVVSNVVNIMFSKEIDSYDPRARHDDLVDPSTMLQDFRSLLLIHHNFSFLFNCLLVTTNSHYKVSMWK